MKKEHFWGKIPFDLPPAEQKNVLGMIVTDPQGSYTGNPLEKEELPVQDADDL